MCRAAAHELCDERRAEVEAAGGRIVAVLTDGVEEPAAAFAKVAFGGEAYRKDIYHDVEARFFKQVGGGEIRRGNLVELLNPFGQAMKNFGKASKYLREKGIDSNLDGQKGLGDGFTFGGVMVVAPGDAPDGAPQILYEHREEKFGDRAPVDDVIAAVKRASSQTAGAPAP